MLLPKEENRTKRTYGEGDESLGPLLPGRKSGSHVPGRKDCRTSRREEKKRQLVKIGGFHEQEKAYLLSG